MHYLHLQLPYWLFNSLSPYHHTLTADRAQKQGSETPQPGPPHIPETSGKGYKVGQLIHFLKADSVSMSVAHVTKEWYFNAFALRTHSYKYFNLSQLRSSWTPRAVVEVSPFQKVYTFRAYTSKGHWIWCCRSLGVEIEQVCTGRDYSPPVKATDLMLQESRCWNRRCQGWCKLETTATSKGQWCRSLGVETEWVSRVV